MDCKSFVYCSIPLCPMDKDIKDRNYLKDEPICQKIKELNLTEKQIIDYYRVLESAETIP
jgi:hypothetical protein